MSQYTGPDGGMASGTVGYAVPAEKPRSELPDLLAKVESCMKKTSDTYDVLAQLHDRTFGPSPETPPGVSPRPVRGGIVGHLHDRSDDLGMMLDRLRNLAADLARIA
jgi:hypothetical protein